MHVLVSPTNVLILISGERYPFRANFNNIELFHEAKSILLAIPTTIK